jgi:membrane-bound lytic murein transglycosylase F
MRFLKQIGIFILFLLHIVACNNRPEVVTPPWAGNAGVEDSSDFDLPEIQQAGELIGLTLSGPDTYYDYHGGHLGVHYLLGERFASQIGVRLRVEVCRDTAELLTRLNASEADLIMLPMDTTDTLSPGWRIGQEKPLLAEALHEWYHPQMMSEARTQEHQMLSQPRVRRRVFAPMLSRGVISHYDGYFKQYARTIGWDWRLLAAQCYQESTFDPNAQSWAGAKGLMQIMPSTADHLGLPRDQLNNPEQSIAAATRYLKELEDELSTVRNPTERQNLALAAYNGGLHHVRDAMRLAERDGRNPHVWSHVKTYILRLSQPQYYQDTLVKFGYMRGQETAEYVDNIRERYKKYKRSAR